MARNDIDVVPSHNFPNKHCVLMRYRTQKTVQCTDTAEGILGRDNSVFGIILPVHLHLPEKITCSTSCELWHSILTFYVRGECGVKSAYS